MIEQIEVPTLRELLPAAQKLLRKYPSSRVFAFFGEMGSGKTTLIKKICCHLGVKQSEMSSPTFAIINEYLGHGAKIYHFDFYRIRNDQEAFDLGYEDYFYSGHYCFIEWAEKVENLLPRDCVKVQIEVENEKRKLTFQSNFEKK